MPAPDESVAEWQQALFELLPDAMSVQVVSLCTELGLADTIGDGEAHIEDIAAAHAIPQERMIRLVRAFVSIGLGVERLPGVFALTGAGTMLRADVPGSLRGFVLLVGGRVTLESWAQLETCIRTGRGGFDTAFGMSIFDYLLAHPELSQNYNQMMSEAFGAVADAVAEHYDFGDLGSVTDLGGGDGTLLSAVLTRAPRLRGVLFDSATGSAEAAEKLRAAGVEARCTISVGDFFDAVPAGSDVYLLKSIVADWNDERAVAILRNCRAAMPAHGRLLIIETILPDTARPGVADSPHLRDLHMLVIYGGAVRTRAQFEHLAALADLTVTSVLPLPEQNGIAIIEAIPA